MNVHEKLDIAVIKFGALYGDAMRFFREGIASPPILDMVEEIVPDFSPPVECGEYQVPVRWRDTTGIARYNVLQQAGPEAPVVIFHHGSGDIQYTRRIGQIAPASWRGIVTLIAVSIPFNTSLREYLYGIACATRFAFAIAASVRVIEEMTRHVYTRGCTTVICSGISLGGWVSNLHHACFNSCTEYRPIFAGAALDDLFINTVYGEMVARNVPADSEALRKSFNFEQAFLARGGNNVYSCMARYDQYIHLDRQTCIYRLGHVTVLNRGHVTGALSSGMLRGHLEAGLPYAIK